VSEFELNNKINKLIKLSQWARGVRGSRCIAPAAPMVVTPLPHGGYGYRTRLLCIIIHYSTLWTSLMLRPTTSKIYIAPLQGNYTEAFPAQAWAKIKVLRSL